MRLFDPLTNRTYDCSPRNRVTKAVDERSSEVKTLIKRFGQHGAESILLASQNGYVLWDGNSAVLVTANGQTALPPFTGSLDSLDELAERLIPGFKTKGEFDRCMSYVQMRDYQTRPKDPS